MPPAPLSGLEVEAPELWALACCGGGCDDEAGGGEGHVASFAFGWCVLAARRGGGFGGVGGEGGDVGFRLVWVVGAAIVFGIWE